MTVRQAQKLSEAAVEEQEEFLLMDVPPACRVLSACTASDPPAGGGASCCQVALKYRHAGSYLKDKLLPWLVSEGKVRAHEARNGRIYFWSAVLGCGGSWSCSLDCRASPASSW